MYQSPWILQELLRQQQAGAVRAAARPRPDLAPTDLARAELARAVPARAVLARAERARAALAPPDVGRRDPRFPRARRIMAEVRIWTTAKRRIRRTPSTGRVRGALDRAG